MPIASADPAVASYIRRKIQDISQTSMTLTQEVQQMVGATTPSSHPRRLAMSTVAGDNAQCIPLMRGMHDNPHAKVSPAVRVGQQDLQCTPGETQWACSRSAHGRL